MRSASPALAYDRAGEGPPLVLVHSLGADRRMWDPVQGRLTAARDVIAVDLPGFGGSPSLAGDVSPPELAAAVVAQLDRLGIERAHVAGCSLGGWVALEIALAGRARTVTTLNAAGLWDAPLGPRRGLARKLAAIAGPVVAPLTRSARGRRLVLAGTVAHPERVPAGDAAHLVRTCGSAPGFVPVNAAMRASRFAALARVDVPILLANADRDRLVRRPRVIPAGVRTVTLHDCGHVPVWDDPAQVAAVLLDGSAV